MPDRVSPGAEDIVAPDGDVVELRDVAGRVDVRDADLHVLVGDDAVTNLDARQILEKLQVEPHAQTSPHHVNVDSLALRIDDRLHFAVVADALLYSGAVQHGDAVRS